MITIGIDPVLISLGPFSISWHGLFMLIGIVGKYYPQKQYPNVVNANGQYLGPYIPYIRKSYFDSNPRVLIYAMAQNLARAPRLVKDTERSHLRADSIVLAAGYRPDQSLLEPLSERQGGPEVYTIGDCVEPRKALEAIHEGFEIGQRI